MTDANRAEDHLTPLSEADRALVLTGYRDAQHARLPADWRAPGCASVLFGIVGILVVPAVKDYLPEVVAGGLAMLVMAALVGGVPASIFGGVFRSTARHRRMNRAITTFVDRSAERTERLRAAGAILSHTHVTDSPGSFRLIGESDLAEQLGDQRDAFMSVQAVVLEDGLWPALSEPDDDDLADAATRETNEERSSRD